MTVSIVTRALKGEQHCGDQCGHWHVDGKTILCIADGLGHGKDAEKAAIAAVSFVSKHLGEPLSTIFEACNRMIRDTRGVAMAIVIVDERAKKLRWAGVGNTRAAVVRGTHGGNNEGVVTRLAGNPGIVGGGYKTVTPETMEIGPDDMVIMFTDGIPEGIDLSEYGDMLHKDLQILAETIIRQWSRDSDDAAVLIYRM
jgi:negative regulator of sigma-B (phosphoserine phosphatase)